MIALVNGSPKKNGSNSGVLLDFLEKHLTGEETLRLQLNTWNIPPEVLDDLTRAERIVFSLPLYVDGLPSHFAQNLFALEGKFKPRMVFGIVNCGFYEGSQAKHALGILKFWAEAQGAVFGAGLGIGAGGGSSQLPEPQVIKQLAQAILENHPLDDFIFYQPPFPRWAYKAMAEMGWRYQARQNGLKPRDLDWQFDPKSGNP